jgi:exodeoxyribonuclease-3
MRFISFNVNGIRAIAKKNFHEDVLALDADVICLQETKSTVEQAKDVMSSLEGYHYYGNESKARKGYSGTGILTKIKPISERYDMGIDQFDQEGRVIALEYDEYFLITVYTPNSGNDLARLDYRQEWDAAFLNYLKALEAIKPVIVCGDFNVAHKSIDLARPKANYNKSAGHMQEEIDGMDAYVSNGLVDSFRFVYPNVEEKYSWWSYRGGARDRNVGWRIDYFLVSEGLKNRIVDAKIYSEVHGSDHCPVGLELK